MARIPADHHDEAAGTVTSSAIKRISWGAILAGAVVALIIQLTLNLLGLAIGLGAIDPATEANPLSGIGTGAGIWFVVSSLVALFIGGYAAGRLSGLPRRQDGLWHGGIAWAVVTFLTLFFVGQGIGGLVGTAYNVVQQGGQVLAQGVGAVAPQVGQVIGGQGDVSLQDIQREAAELLRQTGEPELQPENLEERAQQAAEQAQGAAADAARTPADAQQEIQSALQNLLQSGREVASEADRQAVVNVLVARTDMSEAEAEQTVEQWENRYRQARQQISQTASNVGEQAVETTDNVLARMSQAALWAFLALVVGAASAAAGGAAGAPHDLPATPAVRRE